MSTTAGRVGPALVLGTAQFGTAYGATNHVGRVADDELVRILMTGLDYGISVLDTSIDYGDAHARLAPWANRYSVITKLKARDVRGVHGCLRASQAELGVDRLAGVLVHDWHQLGTDERSRCADDLQVAVDRGIVEAVGISGYQAADLSTALEVFDRLDVAQLPTNALDQRLANAPELVGSRGLGLRIQARSLLLQGILAVPGASSHPDAIRFFNACRSAGLDPLAAALGWATTQDWVDEVVVGVTSSAELLQLIDAWDASRAVRADLYQDLASLDLRLIDPRLWKAS